MPRIEQTDLQEGKQRTECNGKTGGGGESFFKRKTIKTSWGASMRQAQGIKSVQNHGNKQHPALGADYLTHIKTGRRNIHKPSTKIGNIWNKSIP